MYIATVPNRSSPPAILLRHSYREDGKVKSKTLLNVTSWDTDKIIALKKLLNGDDDLYLGSPCQGSNFGILFSLYQLAKESGISGSLGKKREGLLSLFLVLARISHQGSRLSASIWSKNQAVKEVLGIEKGFDEDDLYKSLDWLCKNQNQVERKLYKKYVSQHGNPPALVLYDVTSSYFEGDKNALASYGYNRDKKKGKKQIVIGLLTSETGEPLAIRVFKGNTTDCSTVSDQIEVLKQELGIKEVVFIGDKGMVKSTGKKSLTKESWRYITSIGKMEIRKLMKEGVIQYDLFEEKLQEVSYEGKRYVLRLNKQLRDMLNHKRDDRLKDLESKLRSRNEFTKNNIRTNLESGKKNLDALAQRYRLDKFIEITINKSERKLELKIDEDLKRDTFMLDGCYALETDVSNETMDKGQIDARYHDLSKVERNFRTIKTTLLEVRPIYLRDEGSTRAHVFISMLALKLTRLFESKLKDHFGLGKTGRYNMTIDEALGHLEKINFLEYEFAGKKTVKLPRLNKVQSSIFQALGITMPKTVGIKQKHKKCEIR